jgi:hypothetical protein
MVGSPVERGSPLNEIKSPARPPGGSVYLEKEWTMATLYLVKGYLSVDQLQGVPMKLDLQSNTFELNSPSGVKGLDGSRVEKFHWVNSKTGVEEVFFNCNKFKLDGVPLLGFCKITGTKIQLANYSTIKLIPANYNMTFNTGSKEDEFVKNNTLYLVKDNNLIIANKRNLFILMNDKEPEIKAFIKEQRININKEEELILVINYYDSI